jgi:hypothetical protein
MRKQAIKRGAKNVIADVTENLPFKKLCPYIIGYRLKPSKLYTLSILLNVTGK